MEQSDIQDLIHELQSVSLEMDAEQLGSAQKAAAVIEDMTFQACREVVRVGHRGPCFAVLHVRWLEL